MNTNKQNNFSYLIKINVDVNQLSMLIHNSKEVPNELLQTMARERTEKFINDIYVEQKQYRKQTPEAFFIKMLKLSDFEIDDLNKIEIYDLSMNFTPTNEIVNETTNEKQRETRESKINSISNESV